MCFREVGLITECFLRGRAGLDASDISHEIVQVIDLHARSLVPHGCPDIRVGDRKRLSRDVLATVTQAAVELGICRDELVSGPFRTFGGERFAHQ